MKDGTLGLRAIKEADGIALVQSPLDAMYPGMPRSAIAHEVGPVNELADEIVRLVSERSAHNTVSAH
jgi:two-component system CheB/CheR fusion protein